MCTAAGLPDQRRRRGARPGRAAATPARRKVRGYSLGMRQRLGLAAALLGDPRGARSSTSRPTASTPTASAGCAGFFAHLADEGRTVLVSSHQLNEVQEIADRVVILNRGRLVRVGLDRRADRRHRHASSSARPNPRAARRGAGAPAGGSAEQHRPDARCDVRGLTPAQVGHLAFTAGVELHELSAAALRPRGPVLPLTADAASPVRHPAAWHRPRAASDGTPMIRLVRAEFLKLRTTQVWFWLLLAAVAVSGAVRRRPARVRRTASHSAADVPRPVHRVRQLPTSWSSCSASSA